MTIDFSLNQWTVVSGAQTLRIRGHLPTSLSEINTAVMELVTLPGGVLRADYNPAASILRSFNVESVTLATNGAETATVALSSSGMTIRSGDFTATLSGLLPTTFADIAQIGVLAASHAPASAYAGYRVDNMVLTNAAGQSIATIASNGSNYFNLGYLLGNGVTVTDGPDHVQISYTGGVGNVYLDGGSDFISLFPVPGDFIDGGAGIDTVSYAQSLTGVSVTMFDGDAVSPSSAVVFAGSAQYSTFQSIENVQGSQANDTISGNKMSNVLEGLSGSDLLTGGAGADTINGGLGDDTLVGGSGPDTLDGGDGVDRVDYGAESGGGQGVIVNLSGSAITGTIGAGTFTVQAGQARDTFGDTDTLISIEEVRATSNADVLYGGAGDDWFNARGGSDKIVAGGGQDVIYGGGGNDTIDGTGTQQDIINDTDYDFVRQQSQGEVAVTDSNGNVITSGIFANLSGSAVTLFGQTVAAHTVKDPFGGQDFLIDIEGIAGTQNADTLIGGDVGNNSVEFFEGNQGNDYIDGGVGFDEVRYDRVANAFGGTMGVIVNLGSTTVTATLAGNSGITQAGTSFSRAGGTFTVAAGTARDGYGDTDTLLNIEGVRGSQLGDYIVGGSANDRIRGMGGADTLDGGAGLDTLDYLRDTDYGGAQGVVVNLAAGLARDGFGATDQLSNFENVRGTVYGDEIGGDSGANVLTGLDGGDTLRGGGGNDTLLGGGGSDLLRGGAGNDLLDGGADSDKADYSGVASFVSVNLATGVALDGQGGVDALVSVEDVIGSSFGDLLQGNALANRLDGGDGADTLQGGGGDDALTGGNGADVLRGGAGSDFLDGGLDIDTVDYSTVASAVSISLATGAGQDGQGGVDTLVSIENLIGSALGDMLQGNAGANRLDGGAGADTLQGGGGADTLLGGLGEDVLRGGAGNDVLDGGGDSDTADYAGAGASIVISLASGIASNDGQGGVDTLISVENVIGSALADDIQGDSSANRLTGGAGADLLRGGGGADTMFGGAGADTLRGAAGDDELWGGADADVFVFVPGQGRDVVRDFELGVSHDVVQITAPGVTSYAALQSFMTQSGSDVVISFSANDELKLTNVSLASLDSSHFLFV